jgi:hypothetical protein
MAADDVPVMRIDVAPGASELVVSNAAIRGERVLYAIELAAGQHLTVRVTAAEDNAVFQLYAPGARAERVDYGIEVAGEPLAGAAEGDDATSWDGAIDRQGDYLIVVGSTRGNATFKLNLVVRQP